MRNFIITITIFFTFFTGGYSLAEETPDELYLKGRFAEAEKAYSRFDMDHPKDLRYRYNRGCAAYQKSDYKGAKAAFESVARRTKDKEILFKSAYNLGNTSFKAGDFKAAVAHYKKVVQLNPDSEDGRYNLELALRELKKQKEKADKEEKQPQNDAGQKHKKGDQSKKDKDGKSDQKAPPEQEKSDKGDKSSNEQQEDSQRGKGDKQDKGQGPQDKRQEDLSGELKARQGMSGEKGQDGKPPQEGAAMFDRKKAEALLDNLKEDRSRFLRFQVPADKKRGVRSGKDW